VLAGGRSRAYVNGRLCTASQVADISEDLCDIASQHESVSLTDPATHGGYLDAFGRLDSLRDAVTVRVDSLHDVVRSLDAAMASQRGRVEREDFVAWQLREIDELDPRLGEEVELERERARLRHAEKLHAATRRASERLYEGDGTICDELARIGADLEQAAAVDDSLMAPARSVDAARSELVEVARTLARYADAADANPERLAYVEERAYRLQRLLAKHGPTTADLHSHRARLMEERASLGGASTAVANLEAQRSRQLEEVAQAARHLSQRRHEAADALAGAIGRELAQLGMGRARVVVEVTATPGDADGLTVDGLRLTRNGIDRVEFLIAPNRGEDPRPLRKIASGGELSRALLALKRVLADVGPAGTYVFDEVDSGVGGAVAEVIGRGIADIARHRQVLCITHLPQIAALAGTHFVVGKTESGGRTNTTVHRLTPGQRVDEIARMVGGIKVGEAARGAAVELLAGGVAVTLGSLRDK
jgi:DNA repair protein RecN (Recombination protein N)